MDLLQLKYFQITAKQENVTRAANELFISQPALSKMIRSLESELELKLFDRKGRNITLNKYGEKFLEYVNKSLGTLEQGISEIKKMKNEEVIVITLFVAVGSMFLPMLIDELQTKLPNVRFKIIQHLNTSNKGLAYDFAITSEEIQGNDNIILLEEQIHLGVPISHPLALLDSIALSDLKKEKFISLTANNPLRKTMDRFFKQSNFTPNIVFESDDPATVRGLIQRGVGVSLIPSILWKCVVTDRIKLIHITEPHCKRTIYLSSPTDQPYTEVKRSFLDLSRRFFEGLLTSSTSN